MNFFDLTFFKYQMNNARKTRMENVITFISEEMFTRTK